MRKNFLKIGVPRILEFVRRRVLKVKVSQGFSNRDQGICILYKIQRNG
ncbi:hypothetical protein LEP1GSC133_5054 [Leptospira borgpetersenii serovar Pomona str. 200901868]|uniref:Uncharacterized protein n=1 Tax=Leptospira borgpetersenii serovar Pomona str. 200901868 TaxID=1192866 RepID=M6VUP9_LEPBO|nr:hypothetical protein LEP1GSC133_5054 [Leptospira borgpetersenii serovar Pomona str. 200901868]